MEEINNNETIKKKKKLITRGVKNLSRKVRHKKEKKVQFRRRLAQIDQKRERSFLKRQKPYLFKAKKSKRYLVQKRLGNIEEYERGEHRIGRIQQLTTKYRNIKHGRSIENIDVEHKTRDKYESVVRLGENALFLEDTSDPDISHSRGYQPETVPNPPKRNETIELDETDPVTRTKDITQDLLISDLDLNSRKKVFDIEIFSQGGFVVKYNASGRHILTGGFKGNMSAFSWRNFGLTFEISNIGSRIKDICWMMDDSLLAVATASKTRVHDDKGREIHVLHDYMGVSKLEYLPYHFLLVGGNYEKGKVVFKDISLGSTIATVRMNKFVSMTQNKYNALIILGNYDGTVSMISPRDQKNEPLLSMLCHNAPVSHVAVDETGRYMVTNSVDGLMKTWDIRNTFEAVSKRKVTKKINCMSISQKGMLAYSVKNSVKIVSDINHLENETYLKHSVFTGVVTSLDFCPYEDVLGVGYTGGISSMLVPGSGSKSFDSRMPNPYFSDKNVKNWNVDTLLEKIPWQMICLDPNLIGSSGRTKTNQLQLKPELKGEIEDLEYTVKEAVDDEYTQQFYRLRRDQRREIVKEKKDPRGKLKKWYEQPNPDPLQRFLSTEQKIEMMEKMEKKKREMRVEKRVRKRKLEAPPGDENESKKRKFDDEKDDDDKGDSNKGRSALQIFQ